jgi:hypothetical protein
MSDDPDLGLLLSHCFREVTETLGSDFDPRHLARQLLQSWAENTESFQPQVRAPEKRPKIAQYRKLDAPMMVAKRESTRPSTDPTVIMNARHAVIRQKKAERLERTAAKQSEPTPLKPIGNRKVEVPDVDREIEGLQKHVKDRMRAHDAELAERTRISQKVRGIEESAAESIAKEAEARVRAEKDEFEDEVLMMRLKLAFRKQILRGERRAFSIWSSRSQFQSIAFTRAALFSNFRRQCTAFACWRGRLRAVQHEKELMCMERALRREKQMEDTAKRMFTHKALFKYVAKWRARFRASIELKVVSEQHQKRRALIAAAAIELPPDQQESPPKRVLKIPKAKVVPLKTDPKVEAMQKREDARKAKQVEKAQKEADAAQKLEEERIRLEIEAKRKKRLEHRQFLEQEKLKREEMRARETEFETMLARKKYCENAAAAFRQKALARAHLRSWHKILFIQAQFERTAEMSHKKHMASLAFVALRSNAKQLQMERDLAAVTCHRDRVMRSALCAWLQIRDQTAGKERDVRQITGEILLCRTWKAIQTEQKRRRKKKYVAAALWRNRRMLRQCFKAWPVACECVRKETEREMARDDLMSKALQYLDELSSDSLL